MDTAEIVVYLGIAVIIGGLMLVFVGRFNTDRTYNTVENAFNRNEMEEFYTLDKTTLTPTIYKLWEKCGLGTTTGNMTFMYTGDGSTNKTEIFDQIQLVSLCRSFSSLSEGCGEREDLDVQIESGNIEPNRIYSARCEPGTQTMVLS